MVIYPGTGSKENDIKIAVFVSQFGCLHQFGPNAGHSETVWANKMIFTSSSVTSFQKSQASGEINTKCQLSGRRMLRENANFSSSCVSRIPPYRGKGPRPGEGAPHWQVKGGWGVGGGVDIVLDVYKLLALAGRMHYCLVRDANL